MFIIEMTTYESDFVIKNTKRTGAYDIRTFDINHDLSLFVYYFDDYIHLKLRRYGEKPTTISDWELIQGINFIRPDLNLNDVVDVYLDEEDEQVHIKLMKLTSKRNE
ncbi:hypothetical protein SAMN04488100_10569 [Alkalibacterium putridalgicola]|uniref:Uncharacterized protein n=1 Tax=Alkalibacterium putridalgicola TaxID=426703 RepID=A0A1H7RQ62_9LACT|nr:hypothetical protein [Alkalibacterium putridalgicola]GEK88928.1 hypothetical protein APU01nite_09670 [Alkalibacterium putridalgicola]SEL62128.1 hypothetical protein SAMN04488100_10569 [Alkalibacterium putridalgicola]